MTEFDLQSTHGAVSRDRYRFALWRTVGGSLIPRDIHARTCLWVMNNPSIADVETNDPTIRRVLKFSEEWGFRRVYVANVNPYRSTQPKYAETPPPEVLDENDQWLRELAHLSFTVIAAWGAGANFELAARALGVLQPITDLQCIGVLTKDGHPRHPLYLDSKERTRVWTRQP